MKVVLFCGGAGMRMRGYEDDVPKPMVTIGSRPIIWHLMKYYAHFGHKEFILCLGYKGNAIKNYFLHYDEAISNDFILSEGGRKIEYLHRDIDDWKITFVQTGLHANIGERLKAVEPYLNDDEMFLANYSDGLSDFPLSTLIDDFQSSQSVGCMLLVQPTATFDIVSTGQDGQVNGVSALGDTDIWINGGFFVFHKQIFKHLHTGEELVREPFQRLIAQRKLMGVRYRGFWRCMDTFKDKQHLEELESKGNAPWKVWKNDVSKQGVSEASLVRVGNLNAVG